MWAKDHHSSRLKLGRVEGEGQWKKGKNEWGTENRLVWSLKENKPEEKKHHRHQRLSKISFIVLIIWRHCATENVASAATNHTLRLLIPAVGHTPPPSLSLHKNHSLHLCINIYSLSMTVAGLWAGCGGVVSPRACAVGVQKTFLYGERWVGGANPNGTHAKLAQPNVGFLLFCTGMLRELQWLALPGSNEQIKRVFCFTFYVGLFFFFSWEQALHSKDTLVPRVMPRRLCRANSAELRHFSNFSLHSWWDFFRGGRSWKRRIIIGPERWEKTAEEKLDTWFLFHWLTSYS